MDSDVNEVATKVAEILARSTLEPGIREINELTRLSAEARSIAQAYVDMDEPKVTTYASHSRAI